MNPCIIPSPIENAHGDDRWLSIVCFILLFLIIYANLYVY